MMPSSETLTQTVENVQNILPFVSKVLHNRPVVIVSLPKGKRSESGSLDSDDRLGFNSSGSGECIGSPLRLKSYVDYNDVERQLASADQTKKKTQAMIYPLHIKQARECLSSVILERPAEKNPVLCISDCHTNRSKTLCIGYIPDESGKRSLVNISYTTFTSSEGKKMYQTVLKEHRKNCALLPNDYVSVSASASYSLACLGSDFSDSASDDVNEITSSSNIIIFVNWSNVDSLLMSPPADTVANLKLKVSSGDRSSMVYALYDELQLLKDFTAGLTTGKLKWPDIERTSSPLELLEGVLSGSQSKPVTSSVSSEVINVNSIEPRTNLDFTDTVWSVLKVCHSYAELQEVLSRVMVAVSRKRCPPLMVFSTNTNALAKWIYQEQTTQTGSSDSVPLELGGLQAITTLIEIGLEKLTKDYIHAFLDGFSRLVTADKLDRFIKQASIPDRITNLTKLHSVLEMSALLHSYLRLPLSTVRSATASALSHLTHNSSLPADGFQLSVPVSDITQIISCQTPEVWECQLSSGDEENLTLVYITKSESDHCLSLPNNKPGDEDTLDSFYCSIYRQASIDAAFNSQ